MQHNVDNNKNKFYLNCPFHPAISQAYKGLKLGKAITIYKINKCQTKNMYRRQDILQMWSSSTESPPPPTPPPPPHTLHGPHFGSG